MLKWVLRCMFESYVTHYLKFFFLSCMRSTSHVDPQPSAASMRWWMMSRYWLTAACLGVLLCMHARPHVWSGLPRGSWSTLCSLKPSWSSAAIDNPPPHHHPLQFAGRRSETRPSTVLRERKNQSRNELYHLHWRPMPCFFHSFILSIPLFFTPSFFFPPQYFT